MDESPYYFFPVHLEQTIHQYLEKFDLCIKQNRKI